MTNGEKYKTASERRFAYEAYSHKRESIVGEFLWLELEYKAELEPCPFCDGEAECSYHFTKNYKHAVVRCKQCDATTKLCTEQADAIAAWNRRV